MVAKKQAWEKFQSITIQLRVINWSTILWLVEIGEISFCTGFLAYCCIKLHRYASYVKSLGLTLFSTGGDTFIDLFMRGGSDNPMKMPRPCPSDSKKLIIRAFIWGTNCCCTNINSFRILKKIKASHHSCLTKVLRSCQRGLSHDIFFLATIWQIFIHC